MSDALNELDDAIIALAAREDLSPGQMLNHIAELGLKEISYYRRLSALLDTEAALAAYPVAVNRLRRLRERRRIISGVRA